jgi:hypothetical protein
VDRTVPTDGRAVGKIPARTEPAIGVATGKGPGAAPPGAYGLGAAPYGLAGS